MAKLPFEVKNVLNKIRHRLPQAQCDPFDAEMVGVHGIQVRYDGKRYDLVYDEGKRQFRITAVYNPVSPTHFFEACDAETTAGELKRLFDED
jgi:hypothetical protein